jgi:hypothetical protein
MHGNPALAVAVFGTFLTSMSIIAAFSIEKESRWPTPWETLNRARVPIWFGVGLSSVFIGLLADGLDCDHLNVVSLVLALLAVPLGTLSLRELIALSSEQGRWELVVDLLAHSILNVEAPARRFPADLGEIDTEDHVPASFLQAGELRRPQRTGVSIEQVLRVLCEYADRRELESIVRLVDEVHAGACAALEQAGGLELERYLRSVDNLLYVQRSIFGELANRVLAGQLGDATARIAVVRAGEATLDAAGRARQAGGAAGWDAERVEQVVARHLTALARFAGYVTQEVDAQLALRAAAVDLQQAVRWAVDPEPPGMKLPADHPWRSGLAYPDGVLIWLWSTVESASAPFGVAQYASCQILTGEKFWGSYWDGFDVFTEVSRRLAAGKVKPATAAALQRCGGLDQLTLELGAARLAATPPRQPGEPAFEHDPARRDDRHVACDLFLAAAGFKPGGRDSIADLARLLTDRPSGSLWTTVLEELRQLPDDVVPPSMQPPYRHPEACALAVCLRLAPLEEAPSAASLSAIESFVSLLPDPLLESTADLAAAIVSGEPCHGPRDAREARLIEAARFARLIKPGELPRQEAGTAPSGRDPVSIPAGLAEKGFGNALERIPRADSRLRVDLIQCDPRWLDEWAELRAALDAELLAGALRQKVSVRRIVLYDLPGDPEVAATRLHYRWTESLEAATRSFPRAEDGSYLVRQVLADRLGTVQSLPEDYVSIRTEDDDSSTLFDALWVDREGGLIEL